MKLDIPYYSQYRDVEDKNWQKRACGVVCLKMVLDYCKNQSINCDSPSIESLIEEGVFLKGLDKNKNWKQDVLVFLLHNHGVGAYRQEFKSFKIDLKNQEESKSEYVDSMLKEGIKKIINKLNSKNPVLTSVTKKFSDGKKFHLIVLTGFEMSNDDIKGFYYNDPDYQSEGPKPTEVRPEGNRTVGQGGKDLFVSLEDFKKYWRKLAIFISF